MANNIICMGSKIHHYVMVVMNTRWSLSLLYTESQAEVQNQQAGVIVEKIRLGSRDLQIGYRRLG